MKSLRSEAQAAREHAEQIEGALASEREQVSAAASRLRLPIKRDDEKSAVRGSMTATTPRDETANAITPRKVVFSLSKYGANNKTKAGVADVTSAPFDAVDSFVPTNWKPNEIP